MSAYYGLEIDNQDFKVIMSASLDQDADVIKAASYEQHLDDDSSPNSSIFNSSVSASHSNNFRTHGYGSCSTYIGSEQAVNNTVVSQFSEVDSQPNNSPFPHLSNDLPSASPTSPLANAEGQDEEPAVANVFARTYSPASVLVRNKGAIYEKVGEEGSCKMHKFSLYETTSRFFLVGEDIMSQRFRILKIDRTAESGDLSIAEDDIIYTKKEMKQLINAIDDGNKSSGGLKLRSSTRGLLGFIRFTGEYYMLLITKRSQVAMIGGHYIYQVDGTELVSLTSQSSVRSKADRHPEEPRYVSVLNNLDLSRSFYFSYSYDITHTLQYNILRERSALPNGVPLAQGTPKHEFNDMFVWNHHLLKPAKSVLVNTYDWCLPIIHGFVDQATLSIYGRTAYITIIARRSRFFAGARFLKRGANDLGYVANDVETEQIVSEMLTTSFHAPGYNLYANPNHTSYVQHRGSIPLYWSQDSTGVTPKPDIKRTSLVTFSLHMKLIVEVNLVDPFFSAAALHFDDLFHRYGAPTFVLNLVKARERTSRESILLKEYTNAITYLNQFLPDDKKILYKAWDMSRASKSRDQDVIGTLESIAERVLRTTSFFHNGDGLRDSIKMQNGVARTNCIDCLDRTNAAQFVIGKLALGHQLHALGIISGTSIEYDTDAVNLFTHMYHDHGDTIAIQYGGSHLVNTMETYRKINQWTSHSRDMVESFKRYYNNSFLDAQRQEAYNLFLGNYVFVHGQPMLWDLSTDYYLHHADPRTWSAHVRRSYIMWYTPENLEHQEMPVSSPFNELHDNKCLRVYDDYWLEYYRPLALSSFTKIFSFRMNSTLKYIPFKSTQEGRYDLSPFKVRLGNEHEPIEKPRPRKGVTIADPQAHQDDSLEQEKPVTHPSIDTVFPRWMHSQRQEPRHVQHGILKDKNKEIPERSQDENTLHSLKHSKDKSAIAQRTINQFVVNSLDPSVSASEMDEYGRYISHPLNLPLVISSDAPLTPNPDFGAYVASISPELIMNLYPTEDDFVEYKEFLDVGESPLIVTEADTPKKRYKAYRQWLKGKSLFKQQRIES